MSFGDSDHPGKKAIQLASASEPRLCRSLPSGVLSEQRNPVPMPERKTEDTEMDGGRERERLKVRDRTRITAVGSQQTDAISIDVHYGRLHEHSDWVPSECIVASLDKLPMVSEGFTGLSTSRAQFKYLAINYNPLNLWTKPPKQLSKKLFIDRTPRFLVFVIRAHDPHLNFDLFQVRKRVQPLVKQLPTLWVTYAPARPCPGKVPQKA